MARETKVGLLVGLGVILLIGVIISDSLSDVRDQQPANLTGFAARTQQSINPTFQTPPPAPSPRAGSGGDDPHQSTGGPNDAKGISAPPEHRTSSILEHMQVVPTPGELAHRQDTSSVASSSVGEHRDEAADHESPPSPHPRRAQDQTRPRTPPSTRDLPRAYELAKSRPETGSTVNFAFASASDPDAYPRRDIARAMPVRPPGADRAQTPRSALASSTKENEKPGAIIHYVKPGESLYQIAEHYYGNGDYWHTIANQNRDQVGSQGQVKKGTRLVLPNRAGLVKPDSEKHVVPASSRTIEVQKGDTLTRLAAEHLGDADRWRELLDANQDKLETAQSLRSGMTLVLPPADHARGSAGTSRDAAQLTDADTHEYVVQSGDNLHRIARKTLGDGGRWRDVYKANRDKLDDPDDVVVGQTLRIPTG